MNFTIKAVQLVGSLAVTLYSLSLLEEVRMALREERQRRNAQGATATPTTPTSSDAEK